MCRMQQIQVCMAPEPLPWVTVPTSLDLFILWDWQAGGSFPHLHPRTVKPEAIWNLQERPSSKTHTAVFWSPVFFPLHHAASSYNKICRFKGIANMSISCTYIRDIGLYMQRISLEKYKVIGEEEDHSLPMQRET